MILQKINGSFFPLCCYFFHSKDKLAKEWGWEMLLPSKCNPEWSDYCNYLGQYFKRHHSVIAEVTGISLVDAAETVSIELCPSFLNHQSKPAPNCFLLVLFPMLNWLSSSVSRRRVNLCLCGTVE